MSVERYQEQAVNSMTKGEQLLMLFDEVIKNLNFAVMMLKNKNFETYDKCLDKCKRIFDYLNAMLDRQYSIAVELYRLYSFVNQEVIHAQIARREGILEPLIPLVEDMRNVWAEANKLSNMHK